MLNDSFEDVDEIKDGEAYIGDDLLTHIKHDSSVHKLPDYCKAVDDYNGTDEVSDYLLDEDGDEIADECFENVYIPFEE